MEQKHKFALTTGPLLEDAGRYHRLVGRLIYLTITRLDLYYAVHILSQFMQAPWEEHMNAAHRLLRYIKGTPDCGILIRASPDINPFGHCDSYWGICPFTICSLTGYLVILGGSPISWKTRKLLVSWYG